MSLYNNKYNTLQMSSVVLFPSLETRDEARVVSNPLIRVGHIIVM